MNDETNTRAWLDAWQVEAVSRLLCSVEVAQLVGREGPEFFTTLREALVWELEALNAGGAPAPRWNRDGGCPEGNPPSRCGCRNARSATEFERWHPGPAPSPNTDPATSPESFGSEGSQP